MARPSRKTELFKHRKESPKVTVKSKTYGEHERSARGSIKEAVLNEAMQTAGRQLLNSNAPAKLIRDALAPFRKNFTGGQFWQELLKHFAAQAKKGKEYSVDGLSRMDVNKNYPMARMFDSLLLEVNIDMPSLTMELTCNYNVSSWFLNRCPRLDGMQSTIIVLFPDFKENDIDVKGTVLPMKKINDTEPYSFIISIPPIATSYLLFWKVEGAENGMVKENHNPTKSFCLWEVGRM